MSSPSDDRHHPFGVVVTGDVPVEWTARGRFDFIVLDSLDQVGVFCTAGTGRPPITTFLEEHATRGLFVFDLDGLGTVYRRAAQPERPVVTAGIGGFLPSFRRAVRLPIR